MLNKCEAIQKSVLNGYVLSEKELSYRSIEICIRKYKHVNILPLRQKFKVNDMVLFHEFLIGLYQKHYLITYHSLLVITVFDLVTLTDKALFLV